METGYKFSIQKLYKIYSADIYKAVVYKMYATFLQSKELCQLNFVSKMYTKVCRNMECILNATFCIHFVCKMYTKVCGNVG